jgi:hypothetical protein
MRSPLSRPRPIAGGQHERKNNLISKQLDSVARTAHIKKSSACPDTALKTYKEIPNEQHFIKAITMTDTDCHYNEQIAGLRDEIELLKTDFADLQRRVPTEMMESTFPPFDEITHIGCQIFHKPHLTLQELKTKSVWSPKFTIDRKNVRMDKEFSQKMSASQHGLKGQLLKYETVIPGHMRTFAHYLDEPDNLNRDLNLIGSIMRGAPPKGGKPYLHSQGVIIFDFDTDEPKLVVWIDDHVLRFGPVRPAKGSAKWWCEWRPNDEEVSETQA